MLSRICGTLLVLGACIHAQALTLNFTDLVAGTNPHGSGIIATLTIQDVGIDTVHVTLSHNAGSQSGQFITGLWLNLNPLPGNLLQSTATPATKFDGPLSFGLNTEQRAGLNFDVHQGFETSGSGGGVNRLRPGENIFFELTGTGLDSSDFYSTAVPTGGQRNDILAMIHVQGIPSGEGSGHLAAVVPEPVSAVVVGVGALAVALRRRRGGA